MPIATTPKKLTPKHRQFFKSLAVNVDVKFLDVEPAKDAIFDECFENVAEHVAQHGGRIAYGWCIWEWPTVYVEAEHHAVWERPDESLIDITPRREGEMQILFVRDDRVLPDPTFTNRIDNRRFALRPDPDIEAFFDAAASVNSFIRLHSVGREARFSQRDFAPLAYRHESIRRLLWDRYLGRNDPCPCGSGKKFKKCCRSKPVSNNL
jgi:hypothetical protein